MKNLILGIVVLGVLGACNSEPKDEVGRYVPIPPTDNSSGFSILDTKTGTLYQGSLKDSSLYFVKVNLPNPEVKKAKINSSPELSSYRSQTYE